MSRDGIQALLATLLGERDIVVFRPAIARALGAIPALFLCQAAYWQGIKGAGQWWYKLRDADRDADGAMLVPERPDRQSWEWELGLGRAEQEGARRVLRQAGLLEEELRGVPARRHYRVDLDRLAEFLQSIQQIAESDQLVGRNRPARRQESTGKLDEKQPANTETTPSTTHHHRVAVGEIDEFVEAAAWEAGSNVRNPSGFRSRVRSRIETEGASADDVATLARWRAWRDQQQREVSAAEREKRAAAAQKKANDQKRHVIESFLSALNAQGRAEIERQFGDWLASHKQHHFLTTFRRVGITESPMVFALFVEFFDYHHQETAI
ncbi:MAG: hypothetical protein K2P67_07425 [Gallionellaceae bacterium]|nr:hypothetical protein [Gallionellaceae bacterium]